MSGYIDTREGWREVDLRGEGHLYAIYQLAQYDRDSGELVRAWAQEAPVPPLPTEPYTVIRVTWKDGQPAKEYALIGGRWGVMRPDELAEQMKGFEVLAEPRAVTRLKVVSGVIDFFRREAGPEAPPDDWRTRAADTIAAEWEVER